MFLSTLYASSTEANSSGDDVVQIWNLPLDMMYLTAKERLQFSQLLSKVLNVDIKENCGGNNNNDKSKIDDDRDQLYRQKLGLAATNKNNKNTLSRVFDIFSNNFNYLLTSRMNKLLLNVKNYKYKAHSGIDYTQDKDIDRNNLVLSTVQKAMYEFDSNSQYVVLSTFFVKKFDPQRFIKVSSSDFSYMKRWYESIQNLGLNARIFHDGLSSELIKEYTTDKIQFIKVELGERSTNDERFFIYRDYLIKNPQIKAVFLTDISDVKLMRDPFELLNIVGDKLLVGTDRSTYIKGNLWLIEKSKTCLKDVLNQDQMNDFKRMMTVYNAGLIGGYTNSIIPFLNTMSRFMVIPKSNENCNMPILNFVLHFYFQEIIYTGFPLNSRFYAKESEPEGIYVVHK